MKSKRETVNGILLLDKPAGITSNGALQRAKRLMNARKAGHTGSLDPIATGLLPLCFGEATKVSTYLLEASKTYIADIQLGVTTETCDIEGEVVEERAVNVTASDITTALEDFRGDILQVPPMYSALKRDGQPLYKLARQGIVVEREARPVTMYGLELDSYSADTAVARLTMDVSSGFYVRALAYDLGELLGCGGHVITLRRTSVAGFQIDDAVTLDALDALDDPAACQSRLIASDLGLAHLSAVELNVDAAFYLCRGQAVRAPDLPETGTLVRLYCAQAGFLGLGTITDDGSVAPKRLFVSA